jgi:hypothetical protein
MSLTITIGGANSKSSIIHESPSAQISTEGSTAAASALANSGANDQFISDFLNPTYLKVILPFDVSNAADFDKIVSFFDSSYGLVITRTAKGCKSVLSFSDKDALTFIVIDIFDTYENWYTYVDWRLMNDPTIFFPQLINSPIFPTVDLSGWLAAGGAGVYLPDIVEVRRAAQIAGGNTVDICNNDYLFNPVYDPVQFVAKYFAGYVNKTNVMVTKEYSVDTTGSIATILNATGGSHIVR